MSYDVFIYRREVFAAVASGIAVDETPHPAFSDEVVSRLVKRLEEFGYGNEQTTPFGREFIKEISGCPIQVHLYSEEIAFAVPYWDNNQAALSEMLSNSAALIDDKTLAWWNPQTDEWRTK